MAQARPDARPAELLEVDLTDHARYRAGFPHEVFTELRRRGPVHRHPPVMLPRARREQAFWVVVAHAEIQAVNRDWATFSAVDGPTITRLPTAERGHTIVSTDPPAHTRLRRLVSAGFTPRMIARLDEQMVARADAIVDAVAGRDECDFVREVAWLLPMHMIADIVGIPDADRAWVFARTDTIMRAGDPDSGVGADDQSRASLELYEYADRLGREKRRSPADDVWSILATAEVDDGDGGRTRLGEIELDAFFFILAIAGSETTRNAISQGLVALHERPDQLAALRVEPGLLDTAADEIIRWASPVTMFGRTATRDVVLGGHQVAAGDRVTMWYPSGNRDESVFDEPFRFDVRRSPNPHQSFGGGGVHHCLGAHLARREVRAMFERLLARCPEIEVTGAPVWSVTGPDHSVAVSLDRLPVRLAAR